MSWLTVASCLHIGANEARVDLVKRWLERAKKLRAQIALIGDVLDMGCFSGTAHTGSTWENYETPEEQMEEAVELLKPYTQQITCILTGNHEERIRKATSIRPNKRVAAELGLSKAYRDTHATLEFGGKRVFVAHGAGRSDFTNVLKGWEGLDVIALGHTHTLSQDRVRRRGKAGVRDVALVRCGTFLQEPRYGRLALFPPNPIGAAWIRVTGDGVRVDLGVEPNE